jgi:hypothetical protein
MDFLFQAFILSFKTFLRYLIVMPFVVIPGILVVFTMLATPILISRGAVLVIFLIAPILFSTLAVVLFAFLITALTTFNIMVGCRAAFGAMGRHNELDFGRLVGKSLTFTIAQLAAGLFILLILGGIVAATFLMSESGSQFLQNPVANPLYLVEFMTAHPVAIGVGLLSILLSLSLSALLAVPMAGAAISATPKMGPTDAFIGIGTAFLPILALLVIIAVGCAVSGAYAHMAMLLTKLVTVYAQYAGGLALEWPTAQEWLLGAAMFLFVVWTSCWFYAAAALGWKNYTDEREAAFADKRQIERFEPDELRALREKRDRDRAALA